MGRARQYNKITDPESIAQINPENMALIEDFAIYLQSVDRSPQTIDHYKSDLQIFFVYNLQHNGNKRFTEITKREFVRFQNHALNVWRWSPKDPGCKIRDFVVIELHREHSGRGGRLPGIPEHHPADRIAGQRSNPRKVGFYTGGNAGPSGPFDTGERIPEGGGIGAGHVFRTEEGGARAIQSFAFYARKCRF